MDERNEEGLSIGEFFKMVWSQKILALIIAVAVTLVGTLGLYFGYNALTAEYSVTYRMSFPATDNFLTEYTYPDGTVFYYTSLVSSDTVDRVKATDDKFASINSNAIKIVYNYTPTTTGAATESSFTLSAKTSAFPNVDVAREFFVELANTPVKYFSQINYDYHSTLNSYISAKGDDLTNYDALLTMLESQLETLQEAYENFVDPEGLAYSTSFGLTDTDGTQTTLGAYKSEVDSYAASGLINVMRLHVRNNAIVKSQALKENMALQRVGLNEDYESAKATLDALTQSATTIQNAELVAEQSELVNSLKLQLDDIDRYLGTSSVINTNYINTVDQVYTRLEALTTDLEEVTKQVNEKVASVVFTSSTIIEIDEMNVFICGAVSLIIGVIAAIIAGYCVAASKAKKALAASTTTQETLVETTPADKE